MEIDGSSLVERLALLVGLDAGIYTPRSPARPRPWKAQHRPEKNRTSQHARTISIEPFHVDLGSVNIDAIYLFVPPIARRGPSQEPWAFFPLHLHHVTVTHGRV